LGVAGPASEDLASFAASEDASDTLVFFFLEFFLLESGFAFVEAAAFFLASSFFE
jgi:hypothetical protein